MLPGCCCLTDHLCFFFFFPCLMIRDPHRTLIFTHGTIITQHVGKLCNLESVIIL
ncbi:unnamed protein product [Brassica rapa]|uniref:Uncharacterized protein n=1 Tax=Brassica campestris TaxID=3711 RepID=A0A8D9GMG9_BRACM|nr:unnamed protein product [Brassica rapa]